MASSKSLSVPDFNQEFKRREALFNRKIRNHIYQFLKDHHVNFLIVAGSLFRIVTALTRLNEDIEEYQDIDKYLGYQNQTCLFSDQISSTKVLEGQLNNLLIYEVPAVFEKECKNKLIEVINGLKSGEMQKAVLINSNKMTLEKSLKKLGKGAIMKIDESNRNVLLTYLGPNVGVYQAASAGNFEQVRKLLANGVEVDARIRDEKNRTALHAAVENGHKNIVLLLLAYGANVRVRDNDQLQPIDLAIKNDNDDVILRDVFKINEKLENRDDTHLHLAARFGKTGTAKTLVKFGANINALNNKSYTPLYLAIRGGHDETARILVQLGADLNILCQDKTALDMARMKKSKIVDYLIRKGAKTCQEVKSAEFEAEI